LSFCRKQKEGQKDNAQYFQRPREKFDSGPVRLAGGSVRGSEAGDQGSDGARGAEGCKHGDVEEYIFNRDANKKIRYSGLTELNLPTV